MDLSATPAMAHLHPTGHHRHPETEERLHHLLAAFRPSHANPEVGEGIRVGMGAPCPTLGRSSIAR